jgi:hypothetical protein
MSDSRRTRDGKKNGGNEGMEVIVRDNAADPKRLFRLERSKGLFWNGRATNSDALRETSNANWPRFRPGKMVRGKDKPIPAARRKLSPFVTRLFH